MFRFNETFNRNVYQLFVVEDGVVGSQKVLVMSAIVSNVDRVLRKSLLQFSICFFLHLKPYETVPSWIKPEFEDKFFVNLRVLYELQT